MEADTASRKFSDEMEWALNDALFQKLCAEFGQPDVDLFASGLNTKLDLLLLETRSRRHIY